MPSWVKEEDLIRSTQSFHHYVHKYFTITNRVLGILSTHLGESILPVSAIETEQIEKNCHRVTNIMLMILQVVEREDKHVLKSIGPAQYEKIQYPGPSLKQKAAMIKDLHQKSMGLLGNVFGPVIAVQLAKSELRNMMPPLEQLLSLPVLKLNLGDLLQSSEEIRKLLCRPGSRENNLDEAIQIVEQALSILKPPCDNYNDIISEVEAYVTIISENV